MATKKLHDIDVDEYLAESVQVYPESLQEEFVRVPADLAYWNARYAEAVRAYQLSKIDLSRTESALRIEVRESLMAGGAKVTESMIEAAVVGDDRFHDCRLREVEAEVEKIRLYGVIDAVRTKRDMLISIGAQVRAEMESDPSIRERSRGRKLVNE